MFRASSLALFACAVSIFAAAPPEADLTRAQAVLARVPLRFEANQGQFDPSVGYVARAAGYNVVLSAHSPSMSFKGTGAGSRPVTLSLLGSNRVPGIEAVHRLPTRTNYLLGARENWHTEVANYSRVAYHGVYPGIDMLYYGSQNQLEYDFVLRPGADPAAIRMKFGGEGRLSVTPEGDLALDNQGGRVLQKKPVIYQENPVTKARQEISGRYTMLARNVVGVRVDRYDRSRGLVIDPQLVYSTYMGGSGADQIIAMKWYPNGYLYMTGSTDTSELNWIGNVYNTGNSGGTDVFIAIIDTNPTGDFGFVYFTYLGGTLNDFPTALDVDAPGFIYVAGNTASTDFPIFGNSVQPTGAASTTCGFITKLDPNNYGNQALVYSTYLCGSTGNDYVEGIVGRDQGLIYVIGTTQSTDFPVTDGAYAASRYGPSDAFVAAIDPNSSSLVYSTYIGGENDDRGRSIAVDANGLIYFAVETYSTQFPIAGDAYSPVTFGFYDSAIGVIDITQSGTPSLVYCTYFGGLDNDDVRKIALDSNGNLMLTGYTLSSNFPVTKDAFQPLPGGGGDAFVSVVNPFADHSHFVVYSTFLGGSGGEVAYDIAQDYAGNIVVTGYTLSPDFPVTQDAFQMAWPQNVDIFVTRLTPGVAGGAGLKYSSYFGGPTTSVAQCLALSADGAIFVGGYSTGGVPLVGDSTQIYYGGGITDGFILALSSDQPAPASSYRLPSKSVWSKDHPEQKRRK